MSQHDLVKETQTATPETHYVQYGNKKLGTQVVFKFVQSEDDKDKFVVFKRSFGSLDFAGYANRKTWENDWKDKEPK